MVVLYCIVNWRDGKNNELTAERMNDTKYGETKEISNERTNE